MEQLRKQTGRHPDDPEQRMELWLAVKAKQALGAREGDLLVEAEHLFKRDSAKRTLGLAERDPPRDLALREKCVDNRTDSSTRL